MQVLNVVEDRETLVGDGECSVPFESRYPHEAMGVSDAMRSSVSLGEVGGERKRDPRQVELTRPVLDELSSVNRETLPPRKFYSTRRRVPGMLLRNR